MSTITINGVTFDPLAQGPALAAANLRSADASDSDYIPPVQVAPLLCNKFKLDISFPKPLFIFLVLF
jgi:hypothetical protein